MSLLQIVSDARLLLNQSAPSNVVASGDSGIIQMMALLQDIGDELAERNFWQSLDTAGTITGDGVTTLWPLPADFAGLSPGLKFASSLYPLQPVTFPVTDEDLAALKAFPVSILRPVGRIIGTSFEFWPALAAGEILTYNYYSLLWIQSVDTTRQARWTADTDISLIDEKVLRSGLDYRWRETKGLAYSEQKARYERRLLRADGRQGVRREVRMASNPVGGPTTWPGLLPVYTTLTG